MPLPIAAGNYALDGAISQLTFAVRHLGISTVRGTFDRVKGQLDIGEELSEINVKIEADVASVNTGNEKRDFHLCTPDYLDAGNFPKMLFQSQRVISCDEPDTYVLVGDLEIHGVTRQIHLDVTYNGSAAFPLVKAHSPATHYGFSAKGSISRTDFGLGYGVPIVGDQISIGLEAQFSDPNAVEYDHKSMAEYDRARRLLAGVVPGDDTELEQARQLMAQTKQEVDKFLEDTPRT